MSLELHAQWEKHWRHVNKICELLESADAYKALNALKKVLREREEAKAYNDEVVAIVGGGNIGNAIKTLKASGMGHSVLCALPPELLRVPQIWLEGRDRDGKDPGFVRFEWYEAEREYKRLKPLLEEVWEVIELEPEEIRERLRAEVLRDYEILSPDEMGRYCVAFVHKYDLKEVYERKQIKEELPMPTKNEIEATLNFMLDPNRIYGVVPKEDNN